MAGDIDLAHRIGLSKKLDLEGFNRRDWDLFASLHTEDVIVEFNDERSRGLEQYIEMIKQVSAQLPEMYIAEPMVLFGQGEWTCAMSGVESMGKPQMKRVTVARWRGYQICEEYIFMR
jgi:hypothetical protein